MPGEFDRPALHCKAQGNALTEEKKECGLLYDTSKASAARGNNDDDDEDDEDDNCDSVAAILSRACKCTQRVSQDQ